MKRFWRHKFLKLIHLPKIVSGNPLAGLEDFKMMSRDDMLQFFIKYNTRTQFLENKLRQSEKDYDSMAELNGNMIKHIEGLRHELNLAKNLQRPALEEFVFFMGLMALVICLMKGIHAILS